MFALLRKEINSFFSTVVGYIVIMVFLTANSLFLWIFPGELNVLESGYATIDTLFIIAPWVFLFLVPAVTMRMFSEERKTGTIELLLTRPLSDLQIISAKFLAGLILVLFSLLPCLVYFISVYLLGNPVGNIDTGGTWGSFIGLFFLAGIYVSIGIFASSLTDNQIIAFILSLILCFFFFIGFESLSSIPIFQSIDHVIMNLGINEHYKSMSRGVIDSRDMVYFTVVVVLFLVFTKTSLQSRRW
ncbi:MAG: gliding motility-associated ABC transporter permease subunit GldF [Bacteroidales bacterium]|nr:gliding motility-associated ABC transporter permease subunit GldF [Bacteroidales bacterium]